MKSKKKMLRSYKLRFYNSCVQTIKHHCGGSIHPQDTSWEALAFAFECLAGVAHIKTNAYRRCLELAPPFLNVKIYTPTGKLPTPAPTRKKRLAFHNSFAWKRLRYKTLKKYGARCQCCGASAGNGVQIHVDHIKPVSKYWELRLDPANVQVLCSDCNIGKSNLDQTDWR